MTTNDWLERQDKEDAILRTIFENLITYSWACWLEDNTPPTNEAIEAVAGEALQTYKDKVEEI